MIVYVKEQAAFEALVPKLMEKPSWAVDSETTGLDPHIDNMVLLQIGNPEVQYVIDVRRVDIAPLAEFFDSERIRKIFHNAKFDYKFLRKKYGFNIRSIRDTFLAEKCLNAGRKKAGFGLAAVLQSYVGIEMSKEHQTSFRLDGDFTEDQIAYAAKDVEFLHQITREQQAQLIQKNLVNTYILECDAVPCIGDMELAGMALDVQGWRDIMEYNQSEADKCVSRMNKVAANYFDLDLFGNVDINYGSQQQVLKLLQKLDTKVPTYNRDTKQTDYEPIMDTSDGTLKKIKDNDFINDLKKHRSHLVRVNTFGESFVSAIHPITGRIHCLFNQYGTETGRLSKAKDSPINPLNIPRDKAYRNAFIAEPGYTVETDDYAGCELRIWAEISEDPGLLEIFENGLDAHCYVASKLYGVEVTKDNEHKHLRTPAKNLNFGIAYGSGPGRLHDELNASGFPSTYDEAKGLYKNYTDNLFPTGVGFLRDTGKQATLDGWVANMNGRRRYWLIPDPNNADKYPLGVRDPAYRGRMASIEREAGNFVIQSVNADLTKRAMIDIRNYVLENNLDVQFINQVYDEIVTTTLESQTEAFHPIKQKLMQDASPLKRVPMTVDGDVLPFWTK
jgi:DNA polymerase I-like protein with 3'-5' exonuclease and polymerase domains